MAKRFKPTDEHRALVISNMAVGVPRDTTAYALGITCEQLEKHFAPELKHGAELIRMRAGQRLVRDVLAGEDKPSRRRLVLRDVAARAPAKPVKPAHSGLGPPMTEDGKIIVQLRIGHPGESEEIQRRQAEHARCASLGLPPPRDDDDDDDDEMDEAFV